MSRRFPLWYRETKARRAAKAKPASLSDRMADGVAKVACSFEAFLIACVVVVIWAATGPRFDYSDTWQLIINTGTTIITFLMAFLIGANQMRQTDRDRYALLTLKAEFEDMSADHMKLHDEHRAMHTESTEMHAEQIAMHAEMKAAIALLKPHTSIWAPPLPGMGDTDAG